MTKHELLDLICDAQAYLLDHLEVMASRDHNLLNRDINLDDLKDRIFEDEEQ